MDNPAQAIVAFRGTLAAFREVSPEIIQEISKHAVEEQLQAGQILFEPGQPYADAVFILQEGDMELRLPGEPAFVLEPGDVLGLDNYFDESPYDATATAISEVRLYRLPADRLHEMEHDQPELFNTANRLITESMRSQHNRRQPVTGVWSLPARAVMKSPLAACNVEVTVREAFELMHQRKIGSLGVMAGDGRLLGVITLASLSEGLIKHAAQPDDPISEVVCETPQVIDHDAPLWKVQSQQARLAAKYLIVTENDKAVGIVSQTDILQALVSYQRSIIAQIGDAKSFDELLSFNQGLGRIAQELMENNRSAGMAIRALSEIHLAIQRRCIDLVLDNLREEGKGGPPIRFAFIIMGSGGRKEMIIRTDQDNGIILEDTTRTKDPNVREWFADFCDRVNHRLDEVGYEWCTGDIMARNPDFHKTLAEWKTHLTQIAKVPSEKSARWSTIFFDFETLYGDDHLTVALRAHLLEELKQRPRLLKLMVEDDATGSPPLGLFNRLVTASDKERKGKIDLKRNGTRILADAARIYALSEGIDATNTGDRFRALVRQGRLDSTYVESVLEAYDELLELLLEHQLDQLAEGVPLDKLIDPEQLTVLERDYLRMSLRVIKRLQGRMQGDFGTVML
jgi:CBS domain-containing protein